MPGSKERISPYPTTIYISLSACPRCTSAKFRLRCESALDIKTVRVRSAALECEPEGGLTPGSAWRRVAPSAVEAQLLGRAAALTHEASLQSPMISAMASIPIGIPHPVARCFWRSCWLLAPRELGGLCTISAHLHGIYFRFTATRESPSHRGLQE